MIYLQYFKYILKHKWYVMIACFKLGLYWRGIIHDISKFSMHEFVQYARWFFGSKEWACIDGSIKSEFDYAWLHHIHKNKHHWEYWILNGFALHIPEKYIKEMVCDWYGAGRSIKGKNYLKEWFDAQKNKMHINARSMKIVEKYVTIIGGLT